MEITRQMRCPVGASRILWIADPGRRSRWSLALGWLILPRWGRTAGKTTVAKFVLIATAIREKGINPRRKFSGRFNLRINPELHQRLAALAEASGKCLNALVEDQLAKATR